MANTITREHCNYFLAHGMTLNRQLVPLLPGNKKLQKPGLINGKVSTNKKKSGILQPI